MRLHHHSPRDRGAPRHAGRRRTRTGRSRPRASRSSARRREGLARILDRPDALLTSPWLRARQTAAIAAAAWGGSEPKETAALAERLVRGAGRGPRPLPRATRRSRSSATSPGCRSCWRGCSAPEQDERLTFKKGGAALVESRPARRGRLARLVPAPEAAAEAGLRMGKPRADRTRSSPSMRSAWSRAGSVGRRP